MKAMNKVVVVVPLSPFVPHSILLGMATDTGDQWTPFLEVQDKGDTPEPSNPPAKEGTATASSECSSGSAPPGEVVEPKQYPATLDETMKKRISEACSCGEEGDESFRYLMFRIRPKEPDKAADWSLSDGKGESITGPPEVPGRAPRRPDGHSHWDRDASPEIQDQVPTKFPQRGDKEEEDYDTSELMNIAVAAAVKYRVEYHTFIIRAARDSAAVFPSHKKADLELKIIQADKLVQRIAEHEALIQVTRDLWGE